MEKRNVAALTLLLLVAIAAAYSPALRAGFIWNDDTYVTENPTLDGASGLERIWTDTRANEQYYPLVFTAFWLEKALWGLDPFGYHLVNVLLHAGAALLLWGLLSRLSLSGAWLAAATFALHPVSVESVAWVTERKNTLSLVLTLLSAHAWLSFRTAAETKAAATPKKKPRARAGDSPADRAPLLYAAAIATFSLALFAKTTASVLPAVLLVVAWWRNGRLRWLDLKPLLPFFAIGAGLSFHTAWLERTMVQATGSEWAHGPLDRLVLAGRITTFYAGKLLWPDGVAFIYPRWEVDAGSLRQWVPVAGWLALLAGAWVLGRRGRRGPLAAILLFGGVLFPAMGFFNVYAMRYSWVADHFAYQAVAVGSAAIVCGLAGFVARRGAALRRALGVAIFAALATLGTLTFAACRPYKDEETLWRATLAKNPGCFLCLTNLGNLLLEAGRTDEAVSLLERSLEVKPDAVPTHLNLARVEEERGRWDEASAHLIAALNETPSDGEVRTHLATIYTKAGRLDDAIREYRNALATPSPADYLAHNGLGVALLRAGHPEEAIEHLRTCVRLRPDYEHGRANLETALRLVGGR